jgi:hypothetical protein
VEAVIDAEVWLLIGAWLSLGHMFSAAVSWMGGPGELVILLILIAVATGVGAWCVEKGDLANIRAEELAAEPLPADGHPLTAYEQAAIAEIEAAEKKDHQTNRSSE